MSGWQPGLCRLCQQVSVSCVRTKVSRAQRTPRMRTSPNYNFLRTGRSAYQEGFTDMTPEHVEFLRAQYVQKCIETSPLKDAETLLQPKQFTPGTIRCGAVGVKLGSYPMFLSNGKQAMTTLVQLVDTQVVEVLPVDGPMRSPSIPHWVPYPKYDTKFFKVVVGCKNISPEWVSEAQMEIYSKNGVPCKEKLSSFIVPEESVLPVGTPIYAGHFVPGQLVSITGRSLDRGFQGVMKRWNFAGLPASRGVSLAHRAMGATSSTGLSRVLPGRRAAGQMGDKVVLRKNLRILRINTRYNVLYIQNTLPGLDGAFISIRDAHADKKTEKVMEDLPYPTYCPTFHEGLPDDVYANDVHDFSQPSITYDVPEEET
jgi:large subunit ribosomal protein L3